ncbi:hypothetical protein [Pseudaminobacter soli (ex Zhang et al. 2022)]|nr:hypothetical protein [Pseudaminobacter soli]
MPVAPQRGPIDTGTYPNLNVPPEVAAPVLTEEEKAGLAARVESARARQSGSGRGSATTGNSARLKKLAESHGPDTLNEIEAQ